MHALCTIEGLKKTHPEHIRLGLLDPHPGVRENAIRVSESLLRSGQTDNLGQALEQAVFDSAQRVRIQLAFSLGEWKSPIAGKLLGQLARRSSGDLDLQTAIASSSTGHSVNILNELLNESDIDSLGVLVGNLLELAGSEASAGEINKLLRKLSAEFDKRETWRLHSLYALIENAQG